MRKRSRGKRDPQDSPTLHVEVRCLRCGEEASYTPEYSAVRFTDEQCSQFEFDHVSGGPVFCPHDGAIIPSHEIDTDGYRAELQGRCNWCGSEFSTP